MVEVSIVKCDSYNDAEKCVRKAIELIGGITNYIKPGNRVLLKPNLLSPKPPGKAVTTHPKIVEAMINIVHSANGEVLVGDSSGGIGLTAKAFQVSGIQRVAEDLGAKIINFDTTGTHTIKIPNGKVLKEIHIAKPVIDSDIVVSLPKLKTHALTLYTGAIKNMFGTIPGGNKSLIHGITGSSERFSEALIDIYSVLPVHLAIMDGIVGMEGLGPHMGKPKRSGVVLASNDSVGLDAISSAIMGFIPRDIPMLRMAEERGLGTIDLEKIALHGESLDRVKVTFKKPVKLHSRLMRLPASLRNLFVESPRLPFPNKNKCTKCKICEENCPVQAIIVNDYPNFDYNRCILCYCCYELCPEGGIKLKKSLFPRSLYRIKTKG
jgi:uncharacterized protein (DUF362 family)/NAD-dependent dihydropyrimidine dehydrogenase PreA subunit